MTYPDTVSFDVRITCAPADLPKVVKYLDLSSNVLRLDVDFILPDTLPYGDVTDLLGD